MHNSRRMIDQSWQCGPQVTQKAFVYHAVITSTFSFGVGVPLIEKTIHIQQSKPCEPVKNQCIYFGIQYKCFETSPQKKAFSSKSWT